jgi:RHS repeat-associated protein
MTHLINSAGTLAYEYGYDAWGRLRNPANHAVYAPESEPTLFLNRGYTGHEHLPLFGVINMNARLYDPAVGRFLSPDPFVQADDFTQSYNRYSYAINNPLKYTDPSGEKWWHWLIGDVLTGGLLSSTAIGFGAGMAGGAIIAGGTVASTAYGGYLPFSNGMYSMQKFLSPIAIKPSLHLGSDVSGLGIDVSIGMPTSTTSYRRHWGATYYQSFYDNAYSGWESRSGSEVTLLPGISYSGTRFKSGELSQTTNLLTLGLPFSSLSYETDMIATARQIR